MSKLDEIVNDPSYESAAGEASKATIFVFFGTFAYLIFFTDVSPELIGGTIFAVVGMFATSLVIAAPLFLIKRRWPMIALLVNIAEIATTIIVTWAAYMWFFG